MSKLFGCDAFLLASDNGNTRTKSPTLVRGQGTGFFASLLTLVLLVARYGDLYSENFGLRVVEVAFLVVVLLVSGVELLFFSRNAMHEDLMLRDDSISVCGRFTCSVLLAAWSTDEVLESTLLEL